MVGTLRAASENDKPNGRSRRPSGLRKTIHQFNSLAHRTTWLRSDLETHTRQCRDAACSVRFVCRSRTLHAASLPCFCSLLLANFGFRSLIRISETAFLKYSRSKKLKQVWFFTRLFVSLPRNNSLIYINKVYLWHSKSIL